MSPAGVPMSKRIDHLKHYDIAPSGCWVWRGATVGRKGYGCIRSRQGARMAHRFFYENLVGPIPDGLVLDHLCRNRLCVNPAHLEPVTDRENILRGEGLAAICAARTHCACGKPLTRTKKDGHGGVSRYCLDCATARSRALRRKKGMKARFVVTPALAAAMQNARASMTTEEVAAKFKVDLKTVFNHTKASSK